MNVQNLDSLQEVLASARAEIGKVIIGQDDVIELALAALLTRSHALIEGVPGVAKTLLVKTLGRVLGCDTARVQFTPDLMPADITGTSIYDMRTESFRLVKGPIFTTFLLADEINRAPAKTQAALLQAMQEREVTIDQQSHRLDENFTVFATQNPVEYEGTYPLSEAQKDRFMFKIKMGYPGESDELSLAVRSLDDSAPERLLESGAVKPVLAIESLTPLRQELGGVRISNEIIAYAVKLVRGTREHESIQAGAGPRATQYLVQAARAISTLRGRDFVTPDDIREMTGPILAHRLLLRPEFEIEGLSPEEVLEQVIHEVPVPR